MYSLHTLHWNPPTWEAIKSRFIQIAKTDDQREKLVSIVDFFKAEFGKGFFNNCGQNHPICLKLTVNLHLLEELIEFSDNLQELKRHAPLNYEILLGKLKPRIKCQKEGIPFTDIARMFGKKGFYSNFIVESQVRRNPDVEIIDPQTNDSIFIEVSQLGLSDAQSDIQDQHRKLSDTFITYGYDLPKACKQLMPLEGEEMERAVRIIKTLKDKAAYERTFCMFEDRFIQVAVAHADRIDDLDCWCKERGIQRNSVGGLNVNFNDTPRLVNNQKIIKEISQLPKDKPGVVYIPVSMLYFVMMNKPETGIAIMKQLEAFPSCYGVILYTGSVGSLLPIRRIVEEHFIYNVGVSKGITRHLFFIGNPWFVEDLSCETISRFRESLY